MLSITLGLFAGLAVLALYKGMMKARVRTVIDAESGHLQLHDSTFKKDYDPRYYIIAGKTLISELKSIPPIKTMAVRTIAQGMISTTTGANGIQINGIIPEQEYPASQLDKKIIEGKPFDSSRSNEVIIGRKLADKMKMKLNSRLVLTVTDTASEIVAEAFRVTGIYQSDNSAFDEKNLYIQQADLNSMIGLKDQFNEVVILLKDDRDVGDIQNSLRKLYPELRAESWMDLSPETDLMVKTTDIYSYIIVVIIMFALAFGIINTMLMAVLERTREIGMMVALGTNRLRIFMLVMLETVFLTLAGTPVGLLISWLIIEYYNNKGLNLAGMGEEMMRSFGFGTLVYPEFPFDKLSGVVLIVVGTAILSCLFPAIRALRLQPVEALRR